jgi:hypothetical protein
MSYLSSFIRILGGLVVLYLDFTAYHSASLSLASGATGPIQLYGRPTALQPWQLYFMLAAFGFIGLSLCVLCVLPLLKKSK